jgi:antitoxin MazE
MTEVTLDIKRWGNSLGVRLPSAIAREAHLHIDQKVKLSIVDHQIILSPVLENPLSLEDRLAKFDPKRHGGESMVTTEPLGSEK